MTTETEEKALLAFETALAAEGLTVRRRIPMQHGQWIYIVLDPKRQTPNTETTVSRQIDPTRWHLANLSVDEVATLYAKRLRAILDAAE